jgi:membrane protein implicated in regulation of membrane protease activity
MSGKALIVIVASIALAALLAFALKRWSRRRSRRRDRDSKVRLDERAALSQKLVDGVMRQREAVRKSQWAKQSDGNR